MLMQNDFQLFNLSNSIVMTFSQMQILHGWLYHHFLAIPKICLPLFQKLKIWSRNKQQWLYKVKLVQYSHVSFNLHFSSGVA